MKVASVFYALAHFLSQASKWLSLRRRSHAFQQIDLEAEDAVFIGLGLFRDGRVIF